MNPAPKRRVHKVRIAPPPKPKTKTLDPNDPDLAMSKLRARMQETATTKRINSINGLNNTNTNTFNTGAAAVLKHNVDLHTSVVTVDMGKAREILIQVVCRHGLPMYLGMIERVFMYIRTFNGDTSCTTRVDISLTVDIVEIQRNNGGWVFPGIKVRTVYTTIGVNDDPDNQPSPIFGS